MRIVKCAWCGKGRRRTQRDYGRPEGIDVMGQSNRWPSVYLHTSCGTWFADSVAKVHGRWARDLPIVVELYAYKADEVRNA